MLAAKDAKATLEQCIDAARASIANGNLLFAFDICERAIATGRSGPRLHYLQVLALARMGDTDRAALIYDRSLRDQTDVDTLSLGARLKKDAAWAMSPTDRPAGLTDASHAYNAVFDRTGDPFPGINAASLAWLAGDVQRGEALARQVLYALDASPGADYFAAATEAEAHLILGDATAAADAITRALGAPGGDQGARSSTYRQLARVSAAAGYNGATIEPLRPAEVLTYCGHMFLHDPVTEAALRAEIDAFLAAHQITIAYGALACGADILVAEAVLARGGELHVVLPYLAPDFVTYSVAPGGAEWVDRFDRCIRQASEVVIASETPSIGDDWQYAYGSMLMMGYARLRAQHLGTGARQLAIWDGVESAGEAGTAADVRKWRKHGGETYRIAFDRDARPRPTAPPPPPLDTARCVRGIVFADFAGFSKIAETRLPQFWKLVLGRAAAVIDGFEDDVCSRNTWGDALYVVTRTARVAADLALRLRDSVPKSDLDQFGEGAGMRISAHLGAVYRAADPITKLTTFFGREVNRAARIEPIAPVGEVYVTQAFGAVLSMEALDRCGLSYVGRVPLAKNFGEEPMYRLTRNHDLD